MSTFKVSQAVLERAVLRPINKKANLAKSLIIGEDAGEFKAGDINIYNACSVRGVSKSFMAAFAVYSAVNNIYAKNGELQAISDTIIVPAKSEVDEIKSIINSICDAAEKEEVSIISGHTSFSDDVLIPQVSITASGFTRKTLKADIDMRNIDKYSIVMSGCCGIEGTLKLYYDNIQMINERYSKSFIIGIENMNNELSVKRHCEALKNNNIMCACMHDISEGGIFGALWELAEYIGCGMDIYMKKLQIKQETIELCELYNVNPYILESLGAMLIVTDMPQKVIEILKFYKISAAEIGRLNASKDRLIINDDEIRYLEPYRKI